ncbi:MAG TPA: SRPBCC domain-containing protein [Gaiellaceae bacterium]|nr:SRPBCC domain-containing protein [Gaiellaceae bacterium]
MEVEREIVVPEAPDEVWEALTEPERLEEWFATEAELDARPGGEGVFRWGDGDERRGIVRELEEAERLVLDWDDGGSVAIELVPAEDGTHVRVVETSPEFAPALELRSLSLEASAAKPPTPGGKTAPPEAALAWTALAAA